MPGPPSGNPGFTGTVVSGSGNTYQVKLNTGATVSVQQLQIDSSQTIPAGSSVIVIQVGNKYFMQTAVWL